MINKRRGIYLVLVSTFVIFTMVSFVSAGFFSDFFNKITGRASGQVGLNVSVGAGGVAPIITTIFNGTSDASITLNEYPGNTNITINFTVTDADGAANIDDTTADLNITFGQGGSIVRGNNTACVRYQSGGNERNYSCTVHLYWFDPAGQWNVVATITDSGSNTVSNSSPYANITVNPLTGIQVSPANLSFSTGIAAGDTNSTSNNDPLILNNTGNQNQSYGTIQINATNLTGESESGEAIFSGNFSVGNLTGGFDECFIPTKATRMNSTSGNYVNVTGAILPAGNTSFNDGVTGQEHLYFCILLIGTEISQQQYSSSTNNQGPWSINII